MVAKILILLLISEQNKKITTNILKFRNKLYLCIAFEKSNTGCSAVRLAHLLWEQGVPGSNPGIPTK